MPRLCFYFTAKRSEVVAYFNRIFIYSIHSRSIRDADVIASVLCRFFYNLGVQALRNYQCVTNSGSLPQVANCVTSSTAPISLPVLQTEEQARILR